MGVSDFQKKQFGYLVYSVAAEDDDKNSITKYPSLVMIPKWNILARFLQIGSGRGW
jgi:hypothetical protein